MKKLSINGKKGMNSIIDSLTARNLEMVIDMDKMVTLLSEMKDTNKSLYKKYSAVVIENGKLTKENSALERKLEDAKVH